MLIKSLKLLFNNYALLNYKFYNELEKLSYIFILTMSLEVIVP